MTVDFLAVPHDVTATTARVWVGSVVSHPADAARVRLEHPQSGSQWPLQPWSTWPVPGNPAAFIRYQTVSLERLQPATRYPLVLKVEDVERVRLEITTLPERLPIETEPPFRILAGSCFCRMQDDSGRVGRTFASLPDGARPHLKILMGDQVYLDSPWHRYLFKRSETTLAQWFLTNYVETWGQQGTQQGFNQLLTTGANYFCADDHEFWNNAPYPGTLWVNTWEQDGRDQWWALAKKLYSIFQTDKVLTELEIGDFSVRIVDTRLERRKDRSTFIPDADMARLEAWIQSLRGPGMLVIGQPLFASNAGIKGHFADWNLPDFQQYARLCKALVASRQSIVIVTGDVHFGRVASAKLPSGAELVEIISSPMALVDRSSGESWSDAPFWFPHAAIPGVPRVQVGTLSTWKRYANHFVTLELNQRGGGVNLRVRTWETQPADGVAGGMVVAERMLKRMV